MIYNIDEKGISVETNCDLDNCEEKEVYSRSFGIEESLGVLEYTNSLQLDTLQPLYENPRILDGLFTKVTFSKNLFSTYSTSFNNYNTPVTYSLLRFVDKLVLNNEYKFLNWEAKNNHI